VRMHATVTRRVRRIGKKGASQEPGQRLRKGEKLNELVSRALGYGKASVGYNLRWRVVDAS